MENIGLFKAKEKDSSEWVEGYLSKCDGEFTIVDNEGFGVFINPDTICRFTGLTDEKSGKKVWEHDVVKYHFGDDTAEIKFGEYQNCFDSQKTCHVGFYVDWQKDYMRKDLGYWIKMIDFNFVGNAIDNPELLTQQ